MFDMIIKRATIIDGSGQASFKYDIGINDAKIGAVGNLSECSTKKSIDAKGTIACPGFIDVHSHSDLQIFKDPLLQPKVTQGITTEVVGNCGFSVTPMSRSTTPRFAEYIKSVLGNLEPRKWEDLEGYYALIRERGSAVNIASYVGHNTIRACVMGFSNNRATPSQLDRMKNLLERLMIQGAVGLSSGLLYAPGCYADRHEIIELCRVARSQKGYYATHMRNESDKIEESIIETLQIGKAAHIPVHISHLKIVGKRNWGRFQKVLAIINNAIEDGQDVSFDVYPYVAGSTTLTALLPQWVLEGGLKKLIERLRQKDIRSEIKNEFKKDGDWENIGKSTGWENIVISATSSKKTSCVEGMSIQEIARQVRKDPIDTVCDLLIQEKGQIVMLNFSINEGDLKELLKHPRCVIGTDAIMTGGKPHPRLFGTFPRVLYKYVREENVLTWEEAIHKMTGLPAKILGIPQVGLIRPDMYADIVILNPDVVQDKATFAQPNQYSEGISYVINSGEIVFDNGRFTGNRPGRVLDKRI